ncbi:hypothetical protein KAR91_58685 [Candidatus Pacearchaeota archaeon]|nr:hypothetical protein [Candidatus Pacearchaeota archaeon]
MPDELDVEETKIKVNNFLFMSLPDTTTLAEMELIAMDILKVFIFHDEKRRK